MDESLFAFYAAVGWVVGGLLLVVAVTGLSRRVGWSAPLVLVAVGVAASYLPFTPDVRLSPDVVLIVVLPALLFAAALQTSFLEVRARGDSILTLSVGLVLFSVVVIGFVTYWLLGAVVSGVTVAVGLAFGAILAPTDAVSVNALAGTGKVPRRLASLLEGEGLLNDATALVSLNTAITAIAAPSTGLGNAAVDFVRAVVGGIAVGVVVAWIIVRVRRKLRAPVLDTSISLSAPYVAYLPAAAIGGSGFLAVVLTGIWLGYRAPSFQSAESRVAERINWRTVSFVLENGVFLLIGLQLKSIVETAASSRIGFGAGVLIIAGIYLAMVLARFVYVFAATVLYRYGPELLRERRWDWRTAFAISFAGVRGVVTLAAVFLLPEDTPALGFLQLAAFVIVVLSLLQGLGTGPLVRALKLPLPNPEQDRVQVRSLVAEAQTAAIARLEQEATEDDPAELVSSLRRYAEYRVLIGTTDEQGMLAQPDAYSRLRLLMLDSERKAVLDAQREGRYEDSVIDAVLGDFDSIETALKRSYRRDMPKPIRPALRLGLPHKREG
ncbi:cation:proton antiporter [Amnibacterium kyonggiense]|uniref:Sodium/proton antiporter (CPA1 family) n=1 Tax=Amnibacterium kyonggiense TaxID=595671 RepID=A0A4R7FLN7_9MICO|nr:cation:proton antiporter [Amnibacterium kyonggiense]TDS77330.1 sodium/proton antiporter (CPA1 family) [Amnibacterium kyonggiense]